MSLPRLGSFGGDQTSQSLQTSLKKSLENIGSVTVGGSGGSSSGRGGNPVPNTSSNMALYIIGGIAAVGIIGLIIKS